MQSTSTSDAMPREERPVPPRRGCGACGSQNVAYVCDLPIYIKGGNLPDTIWRCADCGTYIRAADYDEITQRGHFEVASYTNPDSEERLYRSRKDFFRFIIRLCEQSLGRPIAGARVLDVGCAYGHLLDLLREHGASTTGIEIVDRLREQVARHGHTAYASPDEIPTSERFDAITMLDCLYLFEEPCSALKLYHGILAKDGCLLIRVTNRTPLFSFLRFLGRPVGDAHFGDGKHCFSYRGLKRLLSDAGFSIERIILWEKGKRHQRMAARMYYLLSFILSLIVRRPLTPGLIVIARPG
ncbi:MAG TPA: class I SAM-dependent methyltransferase [Acidobacteriota bacterium]|nr:class I SAM-dependent methyltransferase [Acidobacteriota bacterium]